MNCSHWNFTLYTLHNFTVLIGGAGRIHNIWVKKHSVVRKDKFVVVFFEYFLEEISFKIYLK